MSSTSHDQDDFYRSLGARIRAARRRSQLSQEALGRVLGLSRTSITNIENGKQAISVYQLFSIAHTLDVSMTDLLPARMRAETVSEHTLEEDVTQREREWITQVLRNEDQLK